MPIIDLGQFRAEREPALSGEARCLMCQHEWVAVAPVGTIRLECPSCGGEAGLFKEAVRRSVPHWQCNCGNDLFHATADGYYCPKCGEWQHGF